MKRCAAKTTAGRRCLNSTSGGFRFCAKHRGRVDGRRATWMAVGAGIGNAIAPGLGGLAVGALAGVAFDNLTGGEFVAKKRLFMSFDFDNDRMLKEFIIGQSKNSDSPFEVVDCSLKEAAPMKTWEEKARRAIKSADVVLVMVGARTHKASGVLKEVQMAREEGVPIFQLIGYREGDYTAVPGAGRLYRWSWDNLKKLLV